MRGGSNRLLLFLVPLFKLSREVDHSPDERQVLRLAVEELLRATDWGARELGVAEERDSFI